MIKNCVASVLILVIISCSNIYASGIQSSGYKGDNIRYSYDYSTKSININGYGYMWDKESVAYISDDIKYIDIGYGVKSVGKFNFSGCVGVENINLPQGLENIDDFAFGWCSNLEYIQIPSSVTNISKTAFYNCYKLKKVYCVKDSAADNYEFYPNNIEKVYITENDYITGDINNDGKISRADLTMLNQYFAGKIQDIYTKSADINNDGKINRADLTILSRYFAGINIEF